MIPIEKHALTAGQILDGRASGSWHAEWTSADWEMLVG
jgi:hypothetical protein